MWFLERQIKFVRRILHALVARKGQFNFGISGFAIIELTIALIFLAIICSLVSWGLTGLGLPMTSTVWISIFGFFSLWALVSFLKELIEDKKRRRNYQRVIVACKAVALNMKDGDRMRASSKLTTEATPEEKNFIDSCAAYFGAEKNLPGDERNLELARNGDEWALAMHLGGDNGSLDIIKGKIEK